MDSANPILTEPGVKYFLKETLKQCREKRTTSHNYYFNLFLIFFFSGILTILLIYKYKTRPTEHDRKKLKNLKRDYFITKVRKLQAKKAKLYEKQITNLPLFESPFEVLHKKFYKV